MAKFQRAAATRLSGARAQLDDNTKRLGELTAARKQALLADDDALAAKLRGEIEALQQQAVDIRDKVAVLEAQAAQEENARRVRAHEGSIQRVEAKLQRRDEVIADAAKLAAALKNAFEKAIELSSEIDAAWPWSQADRHTLKLTGTSIQAALANEFFRISHRPFLGGRPGELAQPSLPGSKCSRPVENLGFPERETPLVDVFSELSTFASEIMRGKPSAAAVVTNGTTMPVPASTNGAAPAPRELSPNEKKLAALLKRQSELSEDLTPEGERKYLDVVTQITTLSAEIDQEGHHG